jgi:hypothetical protein
MRIKLLAAAIFYAVSTYAHAFLLLPPKQCPTKAAIIAAGFNQKNMILEDDGWAAFTNFEFDNTHWTFVVNRIDAQDASDAYNKAAASLASLTFQFGPFQIPIDSSRYACTYSTQAGFEAAAITGTYDHHMMNNLSL